MHFYNQTVPFLRLLLGGQLKALMENGWGSEAAEILLITFKIFCVSVVTNIPECLNDPTIMADWMGAVSQILQKELPSELSAPTQIWNECFSREKETPVKLKRYGLQIAS